MLDVFQDGPPLRDMLFEKFANFLLHRVPLRSRQRFQGFYDARAEVPDGQSCHFLLLASKMLAYERVPWQGDLAVSVKLTFDSAACCIASTKNRGLSEQVRTTLLQKTEVALPRLLIFQERSLLEFAKRLAQLFLRVHHDGAIPCHGLLKRLS